MEPSASNSNFVTLNDIGFSMTSCSTDQVVLVVALASIIAIGITLSMVVAWPAWAVTLFSIGVGLGVCLIWAKFSGKDVESNAQRGLNREA